MKEIRKVFLEQKKKDVRRHISLVGIAVVMLGFAASLIDMWNSVRKEEKELEKMELNDSDVTKTEGTV